MAGKYSIYKYVKLAGKGWRYARAAYHPNGKIKPDAVLVKGVNGKNVEEKHPEGSYFLNFNNMWIPVRGDALEAQHQRKLKLNQVEYERLRGKTAPHGLNLVQFGRKIINDGLTPTSPILNSPSDRTKPFNPSGVSSPRSCRSSARPTWTSSAGTMC